jgi:hypothetical protein
VAAREKTLADTVGATDAAKTAPEIPLPAGVAAPGEAADDDPQPAATEAPPRVDATPVATPMPAAPLLPAARRPPAPTPEPGADEGAPHARSVADIDWTEATGITVVTLAGDGPFAAGTYSYSEIGGDKPRVLVRFKGLELPYRKAAVAVGTGAVVGIRTGWHQRPEGFEQHVVIDLAGANVRLEGFEALGSRIVLKLARR